MASSFHYSVPTVWLGARGLDVQTLARWLSGTPQVAVPPDRGYALHLACYLIVLTLVALSMCGRALEAVPHRGNLPTIAFEWPSSRFAESTKLRELRQTFLAQREWTTCSGSLSLAGLCARTVHVDFVRSACLSPHL